MRKVLTLALLLLAGCPRSQPPTEAQVRDRETDEIASRMGSWKVTLYRVAKVAVRSLPPRSTVKKLAGDKKSLTREEWAALLSSDPSLARHSKRVGFFVAGNELREGARTAAVVALGVAAAKAGGRLAGELDPWSFPSSPRAFGSPGDFYDECKDALADDEDRYATTTVALLPSDLADLAAKREAPFDKEPYDRVVNAGTEHALLGAAWLYLDDDLGLYELLRARDNLLPAEELLARAGRAFAYIRSGWAYHALDELDEIEKKNLSRVIPMKDPVKGEKLVRGTLAFLRAHCYDTLERKEDAARELELARATLDGVDVGLASAVHVLAAKIHFDAHRFGDAAKELRKAAETAPKDAKELASLADEIEKNLPASSKARDIIRFGGKLLVDDLRTRAGSDERWDELRTRTRDQVASWESSFKPTDDLATKSRELWQRLSTAAVGSR